MIRNRQVIGQPAAQGDQVVVYATGIERLANVTVLIGGVAAAPAAITAVPNRAGVFQVTVTVPSAATVDGDYPMLLTGDAPDGTTLRSNVVTLALEAAIQ